MALNFVGSEKGRRKLLLDGHLFYRDKQVQEKVYWKCEKFKSSKCGARVITDSHCVLNRKNEHNHIGDAGHVEAEKVMTTIREKARNTRDAPTYIVASASLGVSQGAAANLPRVSNMTRTIRNIRVKEIAGPALPNFRRDIVFPQLYQETEKGEQFLLYDSGSYDDRILIFSTQRNMMLLGHSKNWYADGTFKTVPPLFQQLYTIHGLEQNNSVPLIYALLSDKRKETYTRLLNKVKELAPTANPQSILTDFEMSMIDAVNSAYPNAIHRGCFFHFCQCIWRKIQANGLKERYESDVLFAVQLRMLPAVAFVPTVSVIDAFNALCESNILPQEAQPVIDYFEDTWIGRMGRRNIRRPPIFPHRMWNCYDGVLQGLPKTNNSIEGWHRGFQEQIGASHPNIWKFISSIKKEQSLNELRIEQYLSGQEPPRQRRKYRDCAERLRYVVEGWDQNINICDYLRGVAHNIGY